MRRSVLVPLIAAAAFTFTAPAAAITVVADPAANLDAFSVSISNATRTITIRETWGANTSQLVDIQFSDFPVRTDRSWTVIKIVTNNTGKDWRLFNHELLNADKSQSNDVDGLSFAQNFEPPVPRTSDVFSDVMVDELDERDFLLFSNGLLANGTTGQFQFGLTLRANGNDSENNPFFLRQTGIVPEPATWAMLITGFGLVGFALRRRKSSIASVAA
jgi:hypothetical protein